MNKRGDEDLLMKTIIVLVLFVILCVVFIGFFTSQASGDLAKKQIFAKQLCVIITGSEPGTIINATSDMIIEKNTIGVSIKKSNLDLPYVYPCENHNFEVEKEGANTIIRIKTKEEITSKSNTGFSGAG